MTGVLAGGFLGYNGDHVSHPARQEPGNAAKIPQAFGKKGVEFLKLLYPGEFILEALGQSVEVGRFSTEAVCFQNCPEFHFGKCKLIKFIFADGVSEVVTA